jgi:signal transduction histidine kinase
VCVAADRRDDGILVQVSDRGPGMDPEARERAFDRFWRDAEGGNGTGLGLAIVKSLVEADGGSISLEARAGGGLRAVVVLPATAPVPGAVANTAP